MPSTPTTRNYVERQNPGENGNTWGDHLNEGGLDVIDWALDGISSFTLSAPKTLTTTSFTGNEANARTLNITGGTGGTITIPNTEKLRLVRNNTSGNVIVTTGSGTSATVSAGTTRWVLSLGSNTVLNIGDALGDMAQKNEATAAQVRALSADVGLTTDAVGSALPFVALTDAASVALDWTSGLNFELTATSGVGLTRALANPTNVLVGSTRLIYVVGGDATARTLTFGTNYKGTVPTIADLTSTKGYALSLWARSSTHIVITSVRAL